MTPKSFIAFAAATCLWPTTSQAQVGFAMDMLVAKVCMTQNWDTSPMQAWLNKMPRAQRMRIYGDMRFEPAQKKCLIKTKPIPVALCEKVIVKTWGLTARPLPEVALRFFPGTIRA